MQELIRNKNKNNAKSIPSRFYLAQRSSVQTVQSMCNLNTTLEMLIQEKTHSQNKISTTSQLTLQHGLFFFVRIHYLDFLSSLFPHQENKDNRENKLCRTPGLHLSCACCNSRGGFKTICMSHEGTGHPGHSSSLVTYLAVASRGQRSQLHKRILHWKFRLELSCCMPLEHCKAAFRDL